MRKIMILGWIGVLVTGAAMVATPQPAAAQAAAFGPAWGYPYGPTACFADAEDEDAPALPETELVRGRRAAAPAVRPAGMPRPDEAWRGGLLLGCPPGRWAAVDEMDRAVRQR